MLKKVIVVLALVVLVGFSFSLVSKNHKTEDVKNTAEQEQKIKLPEKVFAFVKDSLSAECLEKDKQLCAVEQAVKCTINPSLDNCKNLNLPKFIFMQDPGLDRPTEISYKITNRRVLVNNNVEIYTDSTCNGSWFGLCQGTVIYVLTKPENANGEWFVKDIYAIE